MDKKPQTDKQESVSEEMLDSFLDGDSPVSDAYRRIDQAEPPAVLDRAILQTAHEEVEGHRKENKLVSFWLHWMKPMSTIAVMGVCLAIVLRVIDHDSTMPAVILEDQASGEAGSYTEGRKADALKQKMERRMVAAPPADAQNTHQLMNMAPEPTASYAADAEAKAMEEESVAVARKRLESPQGAAMSAPAYVVSEGDNAEAKAAAESVAQARQQLERSEMAAMVAPAYVEPEGDDAASSATRLEQAVVAARQTTEPDAAPAGDAVAAWADGANPSADVWLMGIETLYDVDEPEAVNELQKMALLYPDAVAQLGDDVQLIPDQQSLVLAEQLQDKDADRALKAEADLKEAQAIIAGAEVWAAGIKELLDAGDTEAADIELDKFRRIYPYYTF